MLITTSKHQFLEGHSEDGDCVDLYADTGVCNIHLYRWGKVDAIPWMLEPYCDGQLIPMRAYTECLYPAPEDEVRNMSYKSKSVRTNEAV